MTLLNISFNHRLLYGTGKYISLKINVLSSSACMTLPCSSMCVSISPNTHGMFIIYNHVYYMYISKKGEDYRIHIYILIISFFFQPKNNRNT